MRAHIISSSVTLARRTFQSWEQKEDEAEAALFAAEENVNKTNYRDTPVRTESFHRTDRLNADQIGQLNEIWIVVLIKKGESTKAMIEDMIEETTEETNVVDSIKELNAESIEEMTVTEILIGIIGAAVNEIVTSMTVIVVSIDLAVMAEVAEMIATVLNPDVIPWNIETKIATNQASKLWTKEAIPGEITEIIVETTRTLIKTIGHHHRVKAQDNSNIHMTGATTIARNKLKRSVLPIQN